MATYTTTVKSFVQSDAEFRTLIGVVRSALSACGWTQSTQTGEVNPATVTYPGSNNTDAGFEVWTMGAIYMKLSYGRGSATGSFRVATSFGSGANGSGTLTGVVTAVNNFHLSGAPATRLVSDATNYNVYASGSASDGRFAMVWTPDAAVAPFGTAFMVEKFRNSDGTPNSNGFCAAQWSLRNSSPTTSTTLTYIFNAAYAPAWEGNSDADLLWLGKLSSSNALAGTTKRSQGDTSSTLTAGKVYAFPLYPPVPGEKYPLTSILFCMQTDFPVDFSNVTMSMYGASRTFKPMGIYSNCPLQHSNSGTDQWMTVMRYD